MSDARPEHTVPLLELRGAARRYGSGDQEVFALRGVDLAIREGEMVALMGASGSGKSTLMNVLGCLDRVSAGTYRVAGQDTSNLDSDALARLRGSHFGFVFQRYNLLPQLTARGNVEMPAVYANLEPQARHERAEALLNRLGLGDRLARYPNQLSGGQQQRVSIARALVNGGAVILADEPTGALDSANGRQVMELLTELNRLGHTIIVATHDPHVASYAHRIIEVADGLIVSDHANPGLSSSPMEPISARALTEHASSWRASWERFLAVAKMAYAALLAHRLRSGLTLLGVVIGIVSVTMMVAVGESAGRVLEQKFGSFLKLKELVIYPGHVAGDPYAPHLQTLKPSDVEELRRQPYIQSAVMETYTTALLRYGSHNANAAVSGVDAGYFDYQGIRLAEGAGFSEDDVMRMGPVAVIDHRTREQFFPGVDPLNKVIYVGSLPCFIVGVAIPRPGGELPNNQLTVYLPYTTSNSRLTGRNYLDMVWVRLASELSGEEGVNRISDLLGKRHRVQDVVIWNNDTQIREMEGFTQSIRILLAAIALISLIVGGIGVMNIMLVSVTERAREIGVRIAVGARQTDIRRQFLIEAIVLCLIGAAVGVVLAFFLTFAAVYFLPPDWDVRLSAFAVLAATSSAILTGLVFGYAPARNAAALDPVEALARD